MGTTSKRGYYYPDGNDEVSLFPDQHRVLAMKKIDTDMHTALTADIALSRIPNLPAGKTTSGTFADARIPSTIARSAAVAGDISDGDAATLSAAKAYTDDAATAPVSLSRLPNLPASKTTSGTFADARIPNTIARTDDVAAADTAVRERIAELEQSQPYWSGWRQLELPERFISGRILISRYRNEVTLRLETVEISGIDETTEYEYLTDSIIPVGFRPREYADRPFGLFGGSYASYSAYIGVFQKSRLLYFYSLGFPLGLDVAKASGELRYTATDDLPSTLPGDPA